MVTRWDDPTDADMDELQQRLYPVQTTHTTTKNTLSNLLKPDVDSMALIVWLSLTDTLASNFNSHKLSAAV